MAIQRYKRGACVQAIIPRIGPIQDELHAVRGRFLRWAKLPTRNTAGTAVIEVEGKQWSLYDTMIQPCKGR